MIKKFEFIYNIYKANILANGPYSLQKNRS